MIHDSLDSAVQTQYIKRFCGSDQIYQAILCSDPMYQAILKKDALRRED